MHKSVQDLKNEIEEVKKIQTKRILEAENLGTLKRITDLSITNIAQEMEEAISGREEMIKEVDILVKENVQLKINHDTNHPGYVQLFE